MMCLRQTGQILVRAAICGDALQVWLWSLLSRNDPVLVKGVKGVKGAGVVLSGFGHVLMLYWISVTGLSPILFARTHQSSG